MVVFLLLPNVFTPYSAPARGGREDDTFESVANVRRGTSRLTRSILARAPLIATLICGETAVPTTSTVMSSMPVSSPREVIAVPPSVVVESVVAQIALRREDYAVRRDCQRREFVVFRAGSRGTRR